MSTLRQLVQDEAGATAIEYGLIAGLVSVACIGVLTYLGGELTSLFEYVGDTIADAL